MAVADLRVSPERLAEFCRRHRIRRLSFFGSVLRDDFGPGSDVDVLVTPRHDMLDTCLHLAVAEPAPA